MNKLELKWVIEELASYSTAHTELLSLYVPAGYQINKIKNALTSEIALSANIKSKSTRKGVLSALNKAHIRLKNIRETFP